MIYTLPARHGPPHRIPFAIRIVYIKRRNVFEFVQRILCFIPNECVQLFFYYIFFSFFEYILYNFPFYSIPFTNWNERYEFYLNLYKYGNYENKYIHLFYFCVYTSTPKHTKEGPAWNVYDPEWNSFIPDIPRSFFQKFINFGCSSWWMMKLNQVSGKNLWQP